MRVGGRTVPVNDSLYTQASNVIKKWSHGGWGGGGVERRGRSERGAGGELGVE